MNEREKRREENSKEKERYGSKGTRANLAFDIYFALRERGDESFWDCEKRGERNERMKTITGEVQNLLLFKLLLLPFQLFAIISQHCKKNVGRFIGPLRGRRGGFTAVFTIRSRRRQR